MIDGQNYKKKNNDTVFAYTYSSARWTAKISNNSRNETKVYSNVKRKAAKIRTTNQRVTDGGTDVDRHRRTWLDCRGRHLWIVDRPLHLSNNNGPQCCTVEMGQYGKIPRLVCLVRAGSGRRCVVLISLTHSVYFYFFFHFITFVLLLHWHVAQHRYTTYDWAYSVSSDSFSRV